MDFAELKKMDTVSLKTEVDSLKKELFNLRLSTQAGQIKDFSQFRKLRVKIAQCLTLVNKGGVLVASTVKKTDVKQKGTRK